LQKILNDGIASYVTYAGAEQAVRQQCDEYVYTMPGLVYTDAEASRRASLKTDILGYIQTMKAQFIRGEVDIDAEWDNFVKKIESIGLEELMSIEQAAYNRYSVNLK